MSTDRTNDEWLRDLRGDGAPRDAAIAQLREYLLRAILVYLTRHRSDLAGLDYEELHQLSEDWAQAALLQVMGKLGTFRGASKFTTWAYRVAINLAAADLRRKRWDDLSVEQLTERHPGALAHQMDDQTAPSPEVAMTRSQIWDAIWEVITQDLTPRQRTALIRGVLDGAPMEVVAEELETNRNNVYKIVHDARRKLRAVLEARGWRAEDVLAAFAAEGGE